MTTSAPRQTPARPKRTQTRKVAPVALQSGAEPDAPEVIAATPTARKTAVPSKAAVVAEPATDENETDASTETATVIDDETHPVDNTDEAHDDNDADEDDNRDLHQHEQPVLTVEGYPEQIGGIAVIREELLNSLGAHAPFRYSRLYLEDGTTCMACRDCWWTASTRGEVMQHRNAVHGAQYGKKKPRINLSTEQGVLDLVLEPREDGTAVPNNPMDWTFREMLALMPTIGALGNLVDQLEYQLREARAERASRRVGSRDDERKIAAYDMHRAEILDLRRFKNDIIKKFSALGFKFEDEDEE